MEGTGVTPDRKSLIDGHPLREQYLAVIIPVWYTQKGQGYGTQKLTGEGRMTVLPR